MPPKLSGRRAQHGDGDASRKKVEAAMREVHTNEPSTVTRAKHFGPGGKEAMLRAIAFSKAEEGK
jgi:hypothetical protein